MVETGPLLGGAFSLLNGLVFLFVGREIAKRTLTGDERLANWAFVSWWYTLGGLSVIGGLFTLSAAYRLPNLAFYLVFLYVAIAGLCVGIAGLGYYLLYVYTGTKTWLYAVVAFNGFYLVYLLWLIYAANPLSIELSGWGTKVVYERDPQTFPYVRPILLVWFVPLVLAAFAYMSLLLKVKLPLQRYRIAMVSATMAVWFGSSVVASALRISSEPSWMIVSRVISLGAALLVFAAFRPPGWVQRRLSDRPPPAGPGGVST
ncbi:MAG: hypothetical protein HYT80_10810 [Euryarchaeota archaeon]|nr:hypothetical protein [Euryarchaeota archaeon]